MDGQNHEEWFYSLDQNDMANLCKKWVERNTEIDLPELNGYDDWLNYFKKLPPASIRQMAVIGQAFMPTEAYAALTRWACVIRKGGSVAILLCRFFENACKLRFGADLW